MITPNFNDICNKYGCDKGDLPPHGNGYAEFYDKWFRDIRLSVKNICEIGIYTGLSIKSFYDYFPYASILGLDIVDTKKYENDRIRSMEIDQSNDKQLASFVNQCQSTNLLFDIILDDGSHDVSHQQISFGHLFKLVNPGGLYIIEDLGSSYFTLGVKMFENVQTQTKINNNTIQFLNQRPFNSLWISNENINFINNNVEYVSIFDKINYHLPYAAKIKCVNDFPIRSITAVIKRKA